MNYLGDSIQCKNEYSEVRRERTARAYSMTHQRREKGMCHGEFLYLVSEGESPMSPGVQEAVLHPQLAEVCHDDPWRA